MSSDNKNMIHKLKTYILRKRLQKHQREVRRRIEEEIEHAQEVIFELQIRKRQFLKRYKQILDEEVEIEKQRYIKEQSGSLEDSAMEKEVEIVEVKATTSTNACMYK